MSFASLFIGWFLLAWAVSWPVSIAGVYAWSTLALRSGVKADRDIKPAFGWYGHAFPRALWSVVFALGATLISTADLGWSP